MKDSEWHIAPTSEEQPPDLERGAASGEFAFAIMVLAIAVVVGGLGGVWIAKREGMQKPKSTEAPQVTQAPPDQAPNPQDTDKPAPPPPNEPSARPQEAHQPAQQPPKPVPLNPPEARPRAAVPDANPAGPRLPSIDSIHYSSRAGMTEVTIDLGVVTLVKAAGLSNPERVYFDFQPAAKPATTRGRLDTQDAKNVGGDALLAGVRVARYKSGDIRVVLDLRRSCDFSYTVAPESASRLIVELKPR